MLTACAASIPAEPRKNNSLIRASIAYPEVLVSTAGVLTAYTSGLTVSNHTPSGADIACSACTVFYKGHAYPIAAGSTTGAPLFVLWTVGASIFTFANSYTPGPSI
jgi:hypothetical protein